ncbi:MAG: hypothetical protein MMC23_009943, partial [Stictis urceolatum]|nr:hypothetical protein [Stictis urceolata]
MDFDLPQNENRGDYAGEWQTTLSEIHQDADSAQSSSKKAWQRDVEEVARSLPPPTEWNVPVPAQLIRAVLVDVPDDPSVALERTDSLESCEDHETLLKTIRQFSRTMTLYKLDLDPK